MAGAGPARASLKGGAGLLALLVAWTVARLWLGAELGLVADEAYYWCWSEALDWGYYDHPPAVAWMIRVGTLVLGDSELGVRAAGILLGACVLGLLLYTERGERDLLATLLLGAPLTALGGLLATPDVVLLAAWVLAPWAVERERWLLAGVACGAALLAKHTGWVLWPALLLATRARPPGIWIAGLVAGVVVLPNLQWNHAHDWVSYGFQLGHGFQGDRSALAGFGTFVGGQAALANPFVFLAVLGWLFRGERDVWWWSAAVPLALFTVASVVGHSEPNWGAPTLVVACVGVARMRGRVRRLAWVGAVLGAALSTLVVVHVAVHPVLPWPKEPTQELAMGQVIGEAAEAWGYEPVLTSRYQEAAWVRFYGGVEATTVPGIGRTDQFDFWPRELADPTVFVRPARKSTQLGTDHLYLEHGAPNRVRAARDGTVIARWQVFEVSGLLPAASPD